MVAIRMRESCSDEVVAGWRCLLCGEAIDPGIEANRRGHRQPIPSRAGLPEVAVTTTDGFSASPPTVERGCVTLAKETEP